jgi:hypothetical protein
VVGGAQVLLLREQAAEVVFAVFRGDGTGPDGSLATDAVTVQVLNGTGTPGQGSEVTGRLAEAGFTTITASDAGAVEATTVVRHGAGHEAMAHLVARHLAGPVRYEVVDDLGDVDVAVVTGSDWRGVAPTPRAADAVPAPSTTTTTAPATTAPAAGAETTGSAATDPAAVPDEPVGGLRDPFFQAQVPPPGADCPRTP